MRKAGVDGPDLWRLSFVGGVLADESAITIPM